VSATGLVVPLSVFGLATPGWAHGQLRPGEVASASTVELVLEVPSEREGHLSTRIALSLPGGLDPQSCRPPLGWTCAATDSAITWDRVTAAAEDFGFTLRVGARSGTYLLPLVQTYEDGETSDFSGPPGRSDEAPRLVVTGAAPQASASMRTSASTSTRPASRPTAVSGATGAGSVGNPVPIRSEMATPVRRSPRAVSSATATGSPSPPEEVEASGEASAGRGLGVLGVLGVLALATLALGLGVLVRRRPGR